MASFNVQRYLSEMRIEQRDGLREQRDGFKVVTERALQIATDLSEHKLDDARIQTEISGDLKNLVRAHKNLKWFTRTMVGAVLSLIGTIIVDVILHHLAHP